jgi:hypothetical protein
MCPGPSRGVEGPVWGECCAGRACVRAWPAEQRAIRGGGVAIRQPGPVHASWWSRLSAHPVISGTVATVVGGLILAGILALLHAHYSGPIGPPAPTTGVTSPGSPSTPAPSKAPTPVWTSSYPVLIPPQSGVDFDSIPPGPGSGSNTLILYLGNELYTGGSIKIAKWTKSIPPTRDQCNVLAQIQGNYEQPAEVGGEYCLLTEQGHTAYLKITSIDTSNTADVKAYANVIVWNTAG